MRFLVFFQGQMMSHRAYLFSLRIGHALRDTAADGYGRQQLGKDLLACITVGIIAIPLAMALAIASGVPPVDLCPAVAGHNPRPQCPLKHDLFAKKTDKRDETSFAPEKIPETAHQPKLAEIFDL